MPCAWTTGGATFGQGEVVSATQYRHGRHRASSIGVRDLLNVRVPTARLGPSVRPDCAR